MAMAMLIITYLLTHIRVCYVDRLQLRERGYQQDELRQILPVSIRDLVLDLASA